MYIAICDKIALYYRIATGVSSIYDLIAQKLRCKCLRSACCISCYRNVELANDHEDSVQMSLLSSSRQRPLRGNQEGVDEDVDDPVEAKEDEQDTSLVDISLDSLDEPVATVSTSKVLTNKNSTYRLVGEGSTVRKVKNNSQSNGQSAQNGSGSLNTLINQSSEWTWDQLKPRVLRFSLLGIPG